jgi:hypothetical protein
VPQKDQDNTTKTRAVADHEVCGVAMYTVSQFPQDQEDIYVYSGPNTMQAFFKRLIREHQRIKAILSRAEVMAKLTDAEQKSVDDTVVCPVCKKDFKDDNIKVKHHCHVTGKFIKAVCNGCNLQLKPRFVKRRWVPKTSRYNAAEDCDEDDYEEHQHQGSDESYGGLPPTTEANANFHYDPLIPVIFHSLKSTISVCIRIVMLLPLLIRIYFI